MSERTNMKKLMPLAYYLRETRRCGHKVSLRAGKLRIKDPLGSVYEENAPTADCHDHDPVAEFISRALRSYAEGVLLGDLPAVTTEVDGTTWKIGESTFRVKVKFAYFFLVEISVISADGIKLRREINESHWPDPQDLTKLRDGLIADHALLAQLQAYLANHETKFKRTHGLHIRGAIDVTFVDGKMILSCFEETDFQNLRRFLDVLDGFPAWSKKLQEEASSHEPLESGGLDLV